MTAKKMNPRSVAAWQAFRDRVAELGGTVLDEAWKGSNQPHRVRCAEGHEAAPTPNNVQSGRGICFACSGRSPLAAEAAFRAAVVLAGGEVLGPYQGNNDPVKVRCAEGHEVEPHPSSVIKGLGICRVCAGRDSAASWASFRAAVESLGGEVLEPSWLGINEPHAVRCLDGHTTTVRPGHVRDGNGICRYCKGRHWDAFYVVVDDVNQVVKFGITSKTGRARLRQHEQDGFARVVLLRTGLPGTVAPDVERDTKALLAQRGARPVRGAEYFPLRWLPTVLEAADGLGA